MSSFLNRFQPGEFYVVNTEREREKGRRGEKGGEVGPDGDVNNLSASSNGPRRRKGEKYAPTVPRSALTPG